MSESDLREDEEEDEEEFEERRRRRRGHERVRGRSYEQLDSLILPLAPRRPPRTYPPPPGQLTRAPSQATMHLTTVPQVGSIPIFPSPPLLRLLGEVPQLTLHKRGWEPRTTP